MDLTSSAGNFTTDVAPREIWDMSAFCRVFTLLGLSSNIVYSLLTNVALMFVVHASPSLRTPPNSHLMNITINNLLLCVSMVLSIVTAIAYDLEESGLQVLAGLQLFIVTNGTCQYLFTFACIGFYRQKTLKHPSMSLKLRKDIVKRTIVGNWVASLLVSLAHGLCNLRHDSYPSMTLNPFRKSFILTDIGLYDVNYVELYLTFVIMLLLLVIASAIIFRAYLSIFRTLNLTGTFGRTRVAPLPRASSVTSTDIHEVAHVSRRNGGNPFCYSISTNVRESTTVHYQKSENTVVFEEIFALENPIKADMRHQAHAKRKLELTLSTTSNGSTRTRINDFTDITAGGDLMRFQSIKNRSALKNLLLRRDRTGLGTATTNCLVMLIMYCVCSVPLFICSIPGVLNHLTPQSRILTLIACRFLFYLNAPAYPTWYLFFNKRVKKCLYRVADTFRIRMRRM